MADEVDLTAERDERARAYRRAYYKANKERLRAFKAAWQETHRAEINAKRRDRYWRKRNKELAERALLPAPPPKPPKVKKGPSHKSTSMNRKPKEPKWLMKLT